MSMNANKPKPVVVNPNGLDPGGQKEADKVNSVENQEMMKIMRQEIRSLRKTNEEEERLINLYNLEKDKLNNLWVIAKKDLDDNKSELMNKERELKDLDENHIMTKNLYKQKVKHLLFQNQDYHGEMKIKLEQNQKQLEDKHRVQEREQIIDNRYLKSKLREQELGDQNFQFALQFESGKTSILARQEFEREARELKAMYDLKMQKVRSEMEEIRHSRIRAQESKKDVKIKEIIQNFSHKYKDIKNYYNDITASNLGYIKQLKSEINELQRKEETDKKHLNAIDKEYQKLFGPLEFIKADLKRLEADKVKWKEVLELKTKERNEITRIESSLIELEFQYEVKLQNFTYLEKAKNELFEKYEDTMYDVHQKAGLKNLILEKKLGLAKERLEVKDCELNQVLSVANIDENDRKTLLENLEETHAMKNELINQLHEELKQIRSAHVHMVKAYDGKLSEFVIPVEELGFNPLVPNNVD